MYHALKFEHYAQNYGDIINWSLEWGPVTVKHLIGVLMVCLISDQSLPFWTILILENYVQLFPYSELVRSNDHHKPYNVKPSFNNYSI